jgi:hypothetical protein
VPPLPLLTAHQGGWDEILLVAGPLAVIAGLLWLADRRARRMGLSEEDGPDRTDRSGLPDR